MLRNLIFGSKPFEEIILHVGLHKTASTSIQTSCAKNRKRLKKQGFHYPIFRLGGRKMNNHSFLFRSLFCDEPDKYAYNVTSNVSGADANRTYAKQLDHACRFSSDRLLISGEGISIIERHQLKELADYLRKFTKSVRVLAFVRHPLEMIESIIQEVVTNGGSISRIKPPGRIQTRIQNLMGVFGSDLEIMNFDAIKSNESGPVGYFFDRLDIDHRDFEDVDQPAANVGISAEAVRLLTVVHANYRQSAFCISKPGRKVLENNPIAALPGAKFRLYSEEIEPIFDELTMVVDWLNRTFGFTYTLEDAHINRTRDEWSASTLSALDDILSRTQDRYIKHAAIASLQAATERLCGTDAAKDGRLRALTAKFAGEGVRLTSAPAPQQTPDY